MQTLFFFYWQKKMSPVCTPVSECSRDVCIRRPGILYILSVGLGEHVCCLYSKTFFYLLFLSGVQIKPETKLTLPKLPAQGSEGPGRQQMSSEEEVRLDGHQQLSSRTLCLPVCRISESVQQLMELAFSTLREAVGSSTQW